MVQSGIGTLLHFYSEEIPITRNILGLMNFIMAFANIWMENSHLHQSIHLRQYWTLGRHIA